MSLESEQSALTRARNFFRGALPIDPERCSKIRVPVDAVCCGCQTVRVKHEAVRDPRYIGSFEQACKGCGTVEWFNTRSRLDGIADPVVFVRAAVLELHDAANGEEPDPDVLEAGIREAKNAEEAVV
ncbi:hypothetical protein B4589_009470 [Halolamina sp. CBA1230]|uniref:hypothetical protein n=1 Tax=Halolamina sp. CBA1230 TaxID=1853690 RepID=UPI0009A177A3|nr:hypothetical protein [Halolamina sp. CBA1230]QKY20594.1 hypothetical protein B4589_009470 [Halolamina sp. CBA1230]